ncbi:MAG: ABC transporter, permease protein, partial [uncultured Gemmatimonadetes bacterium]
DERDIGARRGADRPGVAAQQQGARLADHPGHRDRRGDGDDDGGRHHGAARLGNVGDGVAGAQQLHRQPLRPDEADVRRHRPGRALGRQAGHHLRRGRDARGAALHPFGGDRGGRGGKRQVPQQHGRQREHRGAQCHLARVQQGRLRRGPQLRGGRRAERGAGGGAFRGAGQGPLRRHPRRRQAHPAARRAVPGGGRVQGDGEHLRRGGRQLRVRPHAHGAHQAGCRPRLDEPAGGARDGLHAGAGHGRRDGGAPRFARAAAGGGRQLRPDPPAGVHRDVRPHDRRVLPGDAGAGGDRPDRGRRGGGGDHEDLGDGAGARDRRAQGAGRHPARDPVAVPGRGDDRDAGGRDHRPGDRHVHGVADRRHHPHSGDDSAVGHRGVAARGGGRRHGLRPVPRVQGRAAGPGGGAAVRV